MKDFSLNDYKRIKEKDISELEKVVASSDELKFVLNKKWFLRLRRVLNNFDGNLSFNDGAYDLFRILSYEYSVDVLDKKLLNIACLAEKQGKQRSYRKTRKELSSTQTNQIFGSLFEINILSGIIASCESVELYPQVGSGGQDVEAKLIVDDRAIFAEAKSFGYSKYDPSGRVGVHSIVSNKGVKSPISSFLFKISIV